MIFSGLRRCRRGFSLLEALLAMVVVFMAIGTFLALLPYAFNNNQHDAYYLQAVAAGHEYMEALRAAVSEDKPQPPYPTVPIDAGGSVVGNGLNQSPGNFEFGGGCQPMPSQSELFDCTVTVTWFEGSQQRTYSVETYVTQQVS